MIWQRVRATCGSDGINGVRTKDKVLLCERRGLRSRRARCVTTFSKHNNKLRRAANDSRRDKTKFDTRRAIPQTTASVSLHPAFAAGLTLRSLILRRHVRTRGVTLELTRSSRNFTDGPVYPGKQLRVVITRFHRGQTACGCGNVLTRSSTLASFSCFRSLIPTLRN